MIATTKAVRGGAASATTPPAASIIAAAKWVGAKARSANCVLAELSGVGRRESDHVPDPAHTTAAHTHNTPAISMASHYESG